MTDQSPLETSDAARREILANLRQRARGRQNAGEHAGSIADAPPGTVHGALAGARPADGALRPVLDADQEALVARFLAQAQGMASTTDRVSGWGRVPDALARYLTNADLPRQGVRWPALDGVIPPAAWGAAGLDLAPRRAEDPDRLGVTGCFCALAETGTVMLLGDPERPASVSLLPETHVALVPAWRIVAGMEQAFAWLAGEVGQPPRAINFISGPSRTGDIEQTLVLGAHGPMRVHLIVVDAGDTPCA